MKKSKKRHERARNSENGEKSEISRPFIFFLKKMFSQKCGIIFVWSVQCLFFSSWKELRSDLNTERRVILGQLYGRIKKWARKGPKIVKMVKNISFCGLLQFFGENVFRKNIFVYFF